MKISKFNLLGLLFSALPFLGSAQENSPYSRYGIGNLTPQGNILNRGMGGISAAYADPLTINFINPASYASLGYTTLDVGAEMTSRTLKSGTPIDKFTANNVIISYLQFGFPLLNGNKKALSKNIRWAANFGLKPYSKINYKIEQFSRIPGIDSSATQYEGTGGINQAFFGTALKIRNFSIGINAGYLFGTKGYSTHRILLNDTVSYISSNSATKTNFGGVFFNAGLQYAVKLKNGSLKFGAYGNVSQKYNASQDIIRETYTYTNAGAQITLDSVSTIKNSKGKIQLPATFGAGILLERDHFLAGVDFETTSWDKYRFYEQKDFVANSWTLKAGVQFYPANTNSKRYLEFVKWRAGAYYGNDYIQLNNKMPEMGITAGAGFPLKLKRSFYETQYSVLNIGFEYGSRGNKNNNVRENIFRITAGFSLSDIWFRRYKYD
ncbi:membrane protein [soil metagenome]